MKKLKIVSILLVLALSISMLAACGDPIKDDLKTYVNDQVPAVQTLETTARDAFNTVTGDNYTDDATMLSVITDSVIPASNDALAAAQKIAPATKEVSALNDQYVEVLTSFNDGYLAIQEGLTNSDASKVEEGTQILATAQTQKTDFMTALQTLGKDHGLEVKISK